MNDYKEKWEQLQVWLKGYMLFGKIDRSSGNRMLELMEELEGI